MVQEEVVDVELQERIERRRLELEENRRGEHGFIIRRAGIDIIPGFTQIVKGTHTFLQCDSCYRVYDRRFISNYRTHKCLN